MLVYFLNNSGVIEESITTHPVVCHNLSFSEVSCETFFSSFSTEVSRQVLKL